MLERTDAKQTITPAPHIVLVPHWLAHTTKCVANFLFHKKNPGPCTPPMTDEARTHLVHVELVLRLASAPNLKYAECLIRQWIGPFRNQ